MSKLEPVAISEILGKQFFIRHYQRGYRWTEQQVKQLLDDIDSFSPEKLADKLTFYCLQPVVLKKVNLELILNYELTGEWYEVIDGQQRLTTIYLILHYINQCRADSDKEQIFRIIYETRKDCLNFLNNLHVNDEGEKPSPNKTNIDYYHISRAYECIREWMITYQEKHQIAFKETNFALKLLKHSKIIWYEVEQEEDSIQLFERLNLGKIPLTNAELTKALFLSTDSFSYLVTEEKNIKHYEIASLWDEIEHKLNGQDLDFWSFITNKCRKEYDTKIDLILDLISEKPADAIDPLFTFLWFLRKSQRINENEGMSGLSVIWENIEQFYNVLLEWSQDRDLYHLIGYIISSRKAVHYKKPNLNWLVNFYMHHSKNEFRTHIDKLISDSVNFDISEITYNENPNYIFNILLLFNVETYRNSSAIDDYYPFKQHKSNKWSLEHIHAQNSEGLNKTKKVEWLQWLQLHIPVLKDLINYPELKDNIKNISLLISSAEEFCQNIDTLDWNKFNDLSLKITHLLSSDTEKSDRIIHGLGNMALLSQQSNASLSNSAFEVKRRTIIELDKQGEFIPITTRRIFLGYYSNGTSLEHKYLWSLSDSENYVKEIEKALCIYLPNKSNPNTLN